jgi:hypothetical protein
LYTIPETSFAALGGEQYKKLQGTSVVLSEDNVVITVYRNDERFPGESRKGNPDAGICIE